MTEPGDEQPFRILSLTYSVYFPTLLFSIGQGAMLPIVPLFAKDLGASVAVAGLIVAMRGIGTMIMDLPGGFVVSRFGDKAAMVAGTAMIAVVALGAAFSPSPLILGLLMLIMGGGWAFWQLARLAYVTEMTPTAQRGRVISLLGGTNRFGNFIGPILGGVLGSVFGLESAFYLQAVLCIIASLAMFFVVEEVATPRLSAAGHGMRGALWSTLIEHRSVYLRASIPIIALSLLRQGRQIFLPLWGDHLDLDVATIGVIFGFSFFIDTAFFYPTGIVMDKFGRKWAGVPSLLFLALGLILLPLSSELYSFIAVAALTGVGNGLGSGIVMTLGADYSPEVGRGEFLGVWRLIGDAGTGFGPVAISGVIGLISLGAASVFSGGIGLLGAAVMVLALPETLKRGRRTAKAESAPAETPGDSNPKPG